ncbi:MAG: SDR family NAD(P)-dependent oxidoreductase [Salinirussus sp.]
MARTALIGGLGPGFGESLAWTLAEDGYRVAVMARSADYLQDFVADLSNAGHDALAVPADVTDKTAVNRAFEQVDDAFGPPDAVTIQFSAEGGWDEMSDLTADSFREAWEVYGYGTFLCMNAAVARMQESGGSILVVGATPRYGMGDAHGFVSACAAKRELARSAARELGETGIHVVHAAVDSVILNPDIEAVAPKPIETDRFLDPDSVAEVCRTPGVGRPAWISDPVSTTISTTVRGC